MDEQHIPQPNQQDDEQRPAEQARPHAPVTAGPRLSVVGIGASAGGLAALRTFFSALSPDTGLSFVVVVHLSPEHESILAQLLQPYTAMPVSQVTERVEMQPDHVYVIPPAKRLLVTEGHLDLADFDMPRGHRLQIDAFFRSLAEFHGDGAAVILSGSGSDGAVGIQSIKEGNGLILVQDPHEAEYDGMPKSAIATGLVDVVAPVAQLVEQLVAAKRTGASLELPSDPANLSGAGEETFLQILAHLRVRTGHDFGGYKRNTLLRRISRRMQLAQIHTLSSYLHRLRQDGEEAEALYRDLLIHVTEFFRDPEAWEALAKTVIPRLFKDKGRDDHVRVWTVGCATGEEAYGVGMLLVEHAATLKNAPQIQVFASDLGQLALDFARRGVYPEAIAENVSAQRLEQFFIEENSHFRVRDELREMVLFTPHNLLQDPPFSRLDLILCRNLLIYLQREVQERVFESFHYALRSEGVLFLGSAETAEAVTDLFEPMNKQHRIYHRSPRRHNELVLPSLSVLPQTESRHGERKSARTESARQMEREHGRLAEITGPPSLLIDGQHRVLHLSNGVGRYLQSPDGVPTEEALRMVRPELQSELRSALFHTLEGGKATLTRPVPVTFNGAPHSVAMLVRPARGETTQPRALIFFLEDETPLDELNETTAGEDDASAQQMRAELGQAQRQIQSLREGYETTVEELRAANEELQSTNEEYRSTLEELETSKEELQSINEELETVNQELKNRVTETGQTNSDLQNLLAATEITTLFLDRELRIQRFTPAGAGLFNLMPADRNRPIAHLRSNLIYDDLEADARQVLVKLAPVERVVQAENGPWFQVNVRPYRTVEDKIDGVVITFVDISANKEHELALRESQARLELATEATALGVWEWDLASDRVTTNARFRTQFGLGPDEPIPGRRLLEQGTHPDDHEFIRAQLNRAMDPASPGRYAFECRLAQPDADGARWIVTHGLVYFDGTNTNRRPVRVLGTTLEITAHKRAEETLARELADLLQLQQISALLIEEDDGETLYEPMLDTAIEIMHADFGSIQVLDSASGELVLVAWRNFHPEAAEFWQRVTVRSSSTCGAVLRSGERVTVSDVHADNFIQGTEEQRYYEQCGITAVQSTPLKTRNGELIGMISTHWREVHMPTERELRLLDILARQAADFFERRRAHDAMRRLNDKLEERVEARTQQVRHLVTQLTLSEQAERRRISEILHDDLQQRLYSIQFQLTFLRTALPDALQEQLQGGFDKVEQELGESVRICRSLSVDLSPPVLYNEGLAEAIGWLATQMKERHGLTVQVEAAADVPVPGEDLRVLLFHIVREALFNVVKHAGVAAAKVSLTRSDHHIRVEVVDDGAGFDAAAVQGDPIQGLGLMKNRRRLELVDGALEIESVPGDSTRVVIQCPLPGATE